MALEKIRIGSGPTGVPDYTGYAEAVIQGTVCVRLFNDTGAALVDRTPYYIDHTMLDTDTNGPRAIALVDDAKRHKLVVALEAVPNQSWGWFAYRGLVDQVVLPSAARTTGHAFKVLDGVVTSTGAVPDYDDEEFATNLEATETSTACDMVLWGRDFLATT